MGFPEVGVCLRGGGSVLQVLIFVSGYFMHFFCHAVRFGLVELLIDFYHWWVFTYYFEIVWDLTLANFHRAW